MADDYNLRGSLQNSGGYNLYGGNTGSSTTGGSKDYSSAIGAGLQLAAQAYGVYEASRARKKEAELLAQEEQARRDYELARAEAAASGGGGGGGGGGVNQAALNQAAQIEKEYYEKILKMYAPYIATAKRLLPIREKAYTAGVGGVTDLYAQLLKPENMARLSASRPAYTLDVPELAWMKGNK